MTKKKLKKIKNNMKSLDKASMKGFAQQAAKTFFFTFICVYFGYHLVYGENGVINFFKQKARLAKLETELNQVEEKRNKLVGKVQKLYSNSLDADLLDEQYRRTSGKIKPNEAIYYYE